MSAKSINIKLIESTPYFVKVKFPFLDTPVQMDHKFLLPRLEKGYYKIDNNKDINFGANTIPGNKSGEMPN